MSFLVIDGEHKDPNDIDTLDPSTKKEYGPFSNEEEANDICKGLIQISSSTPPSTRRALRAGTSPC